MISFSLFVILLIVLFPLSSRLKITIHQLFFSLTKSKSWSISLFSLLFFPGTLVHELSHFLIASLLLVPVSNLELVPKLSDNGKVKLGSVQIAKVDFLRRTIIGIAPLFTGLAVLWLIFSYFIFDNLFLQSPASWTTTTSNFSISNIKYLISFFTIYRLLFTIYSIFSISNMMFSSKKDLEALIAFIPFILTMLAILYLLGLDLTGVRIDLADQAKEVLIHLFSALNIVLFITIIIHLASFLILSVLRLILYEFKTI